jgi:C_GCAxxG_C_C family probable redox protein
MGRSRQTCGAVTGALMAIGLHAGTVDAADREGKDRCYRLAHLFIERFTARHASVNCSELLGLDLGTPDGFAAAMARDIHHNVCPAFVRSAAELLEELLGER